MARKKSQGAGTTATLVAPAPDGVGARVRGVIDGDKVGLLNKAPASEERRGRSVPLTWRST
jgi:hypothetical protein